MQRRRRRHRRRRRRKRQQTGNKKLFLEQKMLPRWEQKSFLDCVRPSVAAVVVVAAVVAAVDIAAVVVAAVVVDAVVVAAVDIDIDVVAAVDDVVVMQRRIFYFPFRSLKASKQWNRLKTMEASRVAASARVCCW